MRVKRPGERRSVSRSATRALDVLEFLGEERRPLRAVEIATRLGVQPSSAHQLLKTMVESAHLVFDAREKTYSPSPRLAAFSSWIVETYGAGDLRGLIREIQARTARTDLTITVTTPNDLFMQILDFHSPEVGTAERGLQVSLFGSAIGSAYLSTLEEAEVVRLAERAGLRSEERLEVLGALAQVRRAGYAHGPSAGTDLWSIALPLPAHALPIPAVLGLAGPAETMRARLEGFFDLLAESIAGRFGEMSPGSGAARKGGAPPASGQSRPIVPPDGTTGSARKPPAAR